jgi:hypothetical protein
VLPSGTQFLTFAIDPFNSNQIYALGATNTGNTVFTVPLSQGSQLKQLPGNQPTGTLTGVIAADPKNQGELYIGTDRGLLVGAPNFVGDYQWRVDPNLPDANITSIAVQRNASGFSGDVQISLFGCGNWEMLRTREPCVRIACFDHVAQAECLKCPPPGPRPTSRPLRSEKAGLSNTLLARFEYRGKIGQHLKVRAVPLLRGLPLPFFISDLADVSQGENEAPLTLTLAATDAPLGVHADAVRFEIFSAAEHDHASNVLASNAQPIDIWWLQPHAHLLEVQALDTNGVPVRAKVRITGERHSVLEEITPFAVPVPHNARVEVQAPPKLGNEPNERYGRLKEWRVDEAVRKATSTLSLILSDDREVVAYYSAPPAEGNADPEPLATPTLRGAAAGTTTRNGFGR